MRKVVMIVCQSMTLTLLVSHIHEQLQYFKVL